MDPSVVTGLLCSAAVLLSLLWPGVLLYRDWARRPPQTFGRCTYVIYRSDSYVWDGSTLRCDSWTDLDRVAGEVLEEWFASERGETELLRNNHRERYSCVLELKNYGVGKAWGR